MRQRRQPRPVNSDMVLPLTINLAPPNYRYVGSEDMPTTRSEELEYRFPNLTMQRRRMDATQARNSLPYTGPLGFEAAAPWTPVVVPQETESLYGGSVLGGY